MQLQSNSIDNLILDLRDNQGGAAIHMLSYLLNDSFQYFTEIKSVAGKTDTSQILKNNKGKLSRTHKTQKVPFKGKLIVLINGGSFSNTSSFCSRIEFYKRGIFIGSETGGNKVVFSGEFGLKSNTILPNTKIICENSNYQITVTDINLNQGHGVLPTYSIFPSINDYIQNKDVVLSKAFEFVKDNQ
ncbi:MAG: hypothetical protein IPI10_04945 [Bacteroidetes bacterium]|nr:hypothetical protein [Bacteroidota bacterium]